MIDMKDFEKILKTQEESSKRFPEMKSERDPVEEQPVEEQPAEDSDTED